MEFNLGYVSKLQKLGLTEIQSKVYLILLSLGKEKVSTIAKMANVDRSNVYKAFDKLQKRKIVSKILGSPNLFFQPIVALYLPITQIPKAHDQQNIKPIQLIISSFSFQKDRCALVRRTC